MQSCVLFRGELARLGYCSRVGDKRFARKPQVFTRRARHKRYFSARRHHGVEFCRTLGLGRAAHDRTARTDVHLFAADGHRRAADRRVRYFDGAPRVVIGSHAEPVSRGNVHFVHGKVVLARIRYIGKRRGRVLLDYAFERTGVFSRSESVQFEIGIASGRERVLIQVLVGGGGGGV